MGMGMVASERVYHVGSENGYEIRWDACVRVYGSSRVG